MADYKQALLCTYLSAVLLAGLVLDGGLGRWWADPTPALAIAAIAVHEGINALRGDAFCATVPQADAPGSPEPERGACLHGCGAQATEEAAPKGLPLIQPGSRTPRRSDDCGALVQGHGRSSRPGSAGPAAGSEHDHCDSEEANGAAGEVPAVGPEAVEDDAPEEGPCHEHPSVGGQDPPELRLGLEGRGGFLDAQGDDPESRPPPRPALPDGLPDQPGAPDLGGGSHDEQQHGLDDGHATIIPAPSTRGAGSGPGGRGGGDGGVFEVGQGVPEGVRGLCPDGVGLGGSRVRADADQGGSVQAVADPAQLDRRDAQDTGNEGEGLLGTVDELGLDAVEQTPAQAPDGAPQEHEDRDADQDAHGSGLPAGSRA